MYYGDVSEIMTVTEKSVNYYLKDGWVFLAAHYDTKNDGGYSYSILIGKPRE